VINLSDTLSIKMNKKHSPQ